MYFTIDMPPYGMVGDQLNLIDNFMNVNHV